MEVLKSYENQLADIVRVATKAMTTLRAYISSNVDITMYLLRALNTEGGDEMKSSSAAGFKMGKRIYQSFEAVREIHVEVTQKLFEKYVYQAVHQLLTNEYTQLKQRISERNAVCIDYDAHRYKLAELQKKDKSEPEKIKVMSVRYQQLFH